MELFSICLFFFFNDTATTEIYTLSLHDALPICRGSSTWSAPLARARTKQGHVHAAAEVPHQLHRQDRKSTRLNSSHEWISYAVFCLKKKKDRLDSSSSAFRPADFQSKS